MADCSIDTALVEMEHLRLAEMEAELISMHEIKDNLGTLPDDFIDILMILKQPGDYCLSTTEPGRPRVSIKDEKGDIHHLEIELHKKERYRIRGMLFCSGKTIGELLYKLKEPAFDILSGLLGAKVNFRRHIKPGTLKTSMLLFAENVQNLLLSHKDENFKHFTAEMIICGKLTQCDAVQAHCLSDYEWRQRMCNEIQMALIAEQKNLPIYCPIGFILEGTGYLIYRHKDITQLNQFVAFRLRNMDITARLKLMVGIASVMAELHAAGIYHGAVEMKNFLVKGEIRGVLFNGGDGLAPMGSIKTVTLADYQSLAPEVGWSRRLSPQSDVYSVGRILQTLSDMPSEAMRHDPNAHLMTNVAEIIKRAMSRSAGTRPTMDGVYLRLNEVYIQSLTKK